MSSKLTVIFYIILCFEAGVVLTLLPWAHPFGLGDWGDNFFLLYASQKVGLQGLQHAVSSGWVRGAVTGLGILNLSMAFWEMAHFRQTVQRLQAPEQHMSAPVAPLASQTPRVLQQPTAHDAVHLPTSGNLSDNRRRDDARHSPVE